MSRVTHFEIATENPERVVEFYRSVFGWDIAKWEGPIEYWLATTGSPNQAGIDGAIMPKGDMQPGTYNTLGVESVDETIAKIEAAGGKALMPKSPVPGIGYFAYCADVDGNVFGIMESDPSAS